MIDRENALKTIEENVANRNIVKHMLATEAMMRALCEELLKCHPELGSGSKGEMPNQVRHDMENFNVEDWGLAGLLHDGDYNETVPVARQGIQISEWVESKGFQLPEEVKQAMAAHNWRDNGVGPKARMDWALFCGDSLTGLIVAGALVLPSKRLADLTVGSVLKRFKEPGFAKGTRRDDIKMCEEKLGIPLEEFIKITLEAMQKIAPELGL